MAKCSICTARKGTRQCIRTGTAICCQCCGETRKSNPCTGCIHSKTNSVITSTTKSTKIPMISLDRMETDFDLQDHASAVESSICSFDFSEECKLTDSIALDILRLLLDKYYFKKTTVDSENPLVLKGFQLVALTMEEDLAEVPDRIIAKIVSTIQFVARRRSRGNREYLDFIKRYVGFRNGPGSRTMVLEEPLPPVT